MRENQAQKNKNRGSRLQRGFGKCDAVQLAKFLSHSKLLPQSGSHQLLTDEALGAGYSALQSLLDKLSKEGTHPKMSNILQPGKPFSREHF